MIVTKKRLIGISFILFLFFTSCSSPPASVTVYHDTYSQDSATTYILIDDSIPVGFIDSSLVAIKLSLGNHFINTKAGKKSFLVGEKGGLLNIDNAEYVVFPITYNRIDKSDPPLPGMEILYPTAVAIDSFVIVQHYIENLEDSVILKMISGDEGNDSGELQSRLEHAMLTWYKRLRKIGKGELFISKSWDYDMTDSIPEMITTPDQSLQTAKFMLLPEKFFLEYAFHDTATYTVLNLNDIKSGLHPRRIENDNIPKPLREILKYGH